MPYRVNVKVLPGHNEIFGSQGYKIEQVIAELQKFHKITIVNICAKLHLFLQSEDSKEPINHIRLAFDFLRIEERKRLTDFVKSDDEHSIQLLIFHSTVIMLILKLNLQYNTNEGRDVDDEASREDFMKIYFSVNDLWLQEEKISKSTMVRVKTKGHVFNFKETFRKYQARQYLQHVNNEPLMNAFGRGRYLLEEISKDTHFGFEAEFKDATGLDLNVYLDMIFMLTPKWLVNAEPEKIDDEVVRDENKWFEKMNVSQDDIQRFLGIIGFYADEFNEINARYEDAANIKNNLFTSLITFMNRPIIRYQNYFTIASPTFLMLQMVEGPYNIVREHVKGTSKANDLPNLWGKVYEKYICERLQSTFGNRVRTNVRYKGHNGNEAADVVIDFDEFALICEIKYPHWSFNSRLSGLRKDLVPFMNKIAMYKPLRRRKSHKVKGLGQIKQFILEYRKGSIDLDIDLTHKAFIPVLILGEEFPSDPLNLEYLKEYSASKKCLLNDPMVAPFIIFNSEDIELLESVTEDIKFSKSKNIVINYAANFHPNFRSQKYTEQPTSFKNELYAKGIKTPNSKFLKHQLDRYSLPLRKYFKVID